MTTAEVNRHAADRLAELSVRERQIADLVAEGLTNMDVAVRLDLSEKTVRNYLVQIFDALHLTNRVQLARLVWEASVRT